MRDRRRALGRALVSAPLLALMLGLAAAPPVLACRCIEAEPFVVHAADPGRAVIVGTAVGGADGPMTLLVERWLSGPGASAVVTLRPEGFEGGEAGCGAERPLTGTRWLLVLFDWTPGGTGLVNACTPHADLSTAAGQALLAEAVTAIGQGRPVSADGSPPTSPATPGGPELPWPAIIGLAGIGGLAVVGVGSVALLRRRRAGSGRWNG